jgi:hypothetical protein
MNSVTVMMSAGPSGATRRVWPHQAWRLARRGVAAFAVHGDAHAGQSLTMGLWFVLGGGRQRGAATLSLARVWPRWSAPLIMAGVFAAEYATLHAGLPAAAEILLYAAALVFGVAWIVRSISSWAGFPVGSLMLGDGASAGPPGAGRSLLAAVCQEADRRGWRLSLRVLVDRSKLIESYRAFGFVDGKVVARGRQLIMVRPPECSR